MEWIDLLLRPFGWVNANLAGENQPGMAFVVALFWYALLLLLVAFASHMVFRALARVTRSCAKRLATGATLEDIARLEASSARIEGVLLWLATRVVRTSYGSAAPATRMPGSTDESIGKRVVRGVLRGLWLMLRWVGTFLAALPGLALSGFGIVVLLAAALTAFPDAIRSGADEMESFLATSNWSVTGVIAAVTLAAALVPITAIAVRVLISEAAHARQAFRRGRDERALEQLHRAVPTITRLADVIDDQIREMVRTFEVEKYHAKQWHAWSQGIVSARYSWRIDREDHLECDRDCLEGFWQDAPERVYADDVTKAVAEFESAWNGGTSEYGLKDQLSALSRVISRRAWSGLVSLKFCMASESGRFRMHKVQAIDEWRRRRIAWQHEQLTWSDPTEADIAAGRKVAVRAACSPDERWLESELRDLVWDHAELSRELTDLAEFTRGLMRPRRFERLARVSES